MTKVQRSRHKHHYDINHQIRVSRFGIYEAFVTLQGYLKGKPQQKCSLCPFSDL